VFLESFDSCIFVSSIIVVGSSSSFVIHPHISFGCVLVKLEQQESIQSEMIIFPLWNTRAIGFNVSMCSSSNGTGTKNGDFQVVVRNL
jgi:hypothetical protein